MDVFSSKSQSRIAMTINSYLSNIIKIVNLISSLIIFKKFYFPHTIANKLTGFLLFLAVPLISWCIIPIAIVAIIATFAAVQEGNYIGTRREII